MILVKFNYYNKKHKKSPQKGGFYNFFLKERKNYAFNSVFSGLITLIILDSVAVKIL
jgi:hypothetical protein